MAGLLDGQLTPGGAFQGPPNYGLLAPAKNNDPREATLTGFLSDPQSWKDMGGNLVELLNLDKGSSMADSIAERTGRAQHERDLLSDDETVSQAAIQRQADWSKAKAPDPKKPPEENAVVAAAVTEAEKDPQGSPKLAQAVAKNPNLSAEDATKLRSEDTKANTETAMKSSGKWSEQWQQTWDNFTDNVDLFTMGAALMAMNDGSMSVSQSLGYALQAGREAKLIQTDKNAATAAAAQAAGIKERETRAKEVEALAKVSGEYTDRIKAIAEAAGVDWQDSNTTYDALATTALTQLGHSMDELELSEETVKAIGSIIRTEMEMNPNSNRSEVARQAAKEYIEATYDKTGFFGIGREDYKLKGE
jgi:hypothetical protein